MPYLARLKQLMLSSSRHRLGTSDDFGTSRLRRVAACLRPTWREGRAPFSWVWLVSTGEQPKHALDLLDSIDFIYALCLHASSRRSAGLASLGPKFGGCFPQLKQRGKGGWRNLPSMQTTSSWQALFGSGRSYPEAGPFCAARCLCVSVRSFSKLPNTWGVQTIAYDEPVMHPPGFGASSAGQKVHPWGPLWVETKEVSEVLAEKVAGADQSAPLQFPEARRREAHRSHGPGSIVAGKAMDG